ncbi:MAG: hypothetical protein K1X94_02035 [Sandaracinaceae bacterium]|nr:hypothetical protein [Sandaracinaceae bacterium]
MRRVLCSAVVLVGSWIAGCGAGAASSRETTPVATDPCPRLRSERDDAVTALTRCREASTVWAHQAVFDRALAEVRHVGELGAQGAVPPSDAQRAADAMWELLDAVSPELTNHLALDRAENAAEAILRDREGDPARAARLEAEGALEEIHQVLAPAPAEDPCAGERDRARETADAAAQCG